MYIHTFSYSIIFSMLDFWCVASNNCFHFLCLILEFIYQFFNHIESDIWTLYSNEIIDIYATKVLMIGMSLYLRSVKRTNNWKKEDFLATQSENILPTWSKWKRRIFILSHTVHTFFSIYFAPTTGFSVL